jgi:hypothetical protein
MGIQEPRTQQAVFCFDETEMARLLRAALLLQHVADIYSLGRRPDNA